MPILIHKISEIEVTKTEFKALGLVYNYLFIFILSKVYTGKEIQNRSNISCIYLK